MKVISAICSLASITMLACLPATAMNVSSATNAGIIDDAAPGWIWSGMIEYNGDSLRGGAGHAGGPGSYGAYTFRGTRFQLFCLLPPSITVDGRVHKVGRVKVCVDGNAVNARQSPSVTGDDVCVADISGLSDGNHVVQVSPDAGWIVVDYLQVDAPDDTHVDPSRTATKIASAIPEGTYSLRPRHNSTRSFGSFDGKNVVTLGADGGRYGIVKLTPIDKNLYTISSVVDKSLSFAMMNDPANGGYSIGLVSTPEIAAARWYITTDADGYCRISCAAQPDYVFDVSGDATDVGAAVIGYKWHGGPNQQWAVLPVDQDALGHPAH